MDQKENEVQRWAASERDKEMHSALFALFQECNTKIDDSLTAILVSNEAIRRVLKASPWGKGIK
jgi:hypothetical protein